MKRDTGALLSNHNPNTLVLTHIPKENRNDDYLMEACSKFGPVAAFRLKYDKDTGAPKHWAIVEFFEREHAEACKKAMRAHWATGWKQDAQESEDE